MEWTISHLNNIIQLSIVVTMVSVGLQVTGAQIVAAVSRKRLLAKALLANLVVIPAVALLLVWLVSMPQGLALGFLLVAAAPGAPLFPKLAEIAKADLSFAVGLMVILAMLAIVTTPLTAHLILPLDSGPNGGIEFDVWAVIKSLAILQLLPLLSGLGIRRWLPAVRDRLLRPSILLANVLLALVILLVILRDYGTLINLPWTAVAAMLLLVVLMLLIGWLMGGPGKQSRKTLALGTSAQSNGLALLITSSSFPGSGADTAVVAFGLLNIIINIGVAIYWNRTTRQDAVAVRNTAD